MDALTAAAQSVEAAQQHPHPPQQHIRIHAQTLHSHAPSLDHYNQQQQQWQPDTSAPVATTPTMRITSILNADPESNEADVEFVGAFASVASEQEQQQRECGLAWWNSAEMDSAVPMRGDVRHQYNGGTVPAAAAGDGGRMGMGTDVRWPLDVQRSDLINDGPHADSGARARQQYQQLQPPPTQSPSQYQLQQQWQQQWQQQSQQQQSQLKQQSKPTTAKKKAPAKRERAQAQPSVTAPPAARAKIAKMPLILTSDKFIGNKSSSSAKMGEQKMDHPTTTTTLNHGMWLSEEKAAFDEAFRCHGNNWDKVAECIPTRTRSQVASFGRKKIARAAADPAPSSSAKPASKPSAANVDGTSASSGESEQQLNLASSSNDSNPQRLSKIGLDHLSQSPRGTLAFDSVVTTPRVLDLVNGEPSQRPRRGTRHQEIKPVVVLQPAAVPVVQAPVQVSAPVMNEVIEINTEESATETPQKAPQRTTTRPPRARAPSAKTINQQQQQQQVAMPQRKKAKLSVVVSQEVASTKDAPPASSSSSSAASGPLVPVRNSSSSKPKRGKKRPPQHEFGGITSPMNAGSSFSSSADERECEFCRSARGSCAIMNCTSCKRVYHAKCFVNHFKPHCTSDEPIEKQLETLHLSAPSQVRVKIFRCVPCQAAFIENFRKGGYEWDCECPSCSAPQKIAEYRRRLLLQFVYNKVDEKPSNSKRKNPSIAKQGSDLTGEKEENNSSGAAVAKPQEAKRPMRTGTRRTRNTSAPGNENEPMEVDSEAFVEVPSQAVLDVAASGKKKQNKKNASNGLTENSHAESKTKALELGASNSAENGAIETEATPVVNDGNVGGDRVTRNGEREEGKIDCEMDADAVAEPDQEKEASSRLSLILKPSDAVGDNDDAEQLSEEDILAAVAVNFDGDRERFPVVCTETPSLTASGAWKEGLYYLHRNRAKDTIKCPCCLKHLPRMSREQFVRHADPRFAETEGKTSWDFLFVLHRDGSVVSPLAPFLKLLEQRKSKLRDAALSSPNQKRKHQDTFKIPLRSAETQVEDAEAVKTAVNDAREQLKSVVIARRVTGHAEPKSSTSSRPVYVIRVVCVSSKLTIPMTNGMVQNKLDRSTLGDFPLKDGWLSFDKGTPGAGSSTAVSPLYANVLCDCCVREMALEDFIAHTGLEAWDKTFKRKLVYAPLRDNQRALIEFDRVWQSILTLYKHQALESFMSTISEVNVRLTG